MNRDCEEIIKLRGSSDSNWDDAKKAKEQELARFKEVSSLSFHLMIAR